MRGFQQLKTVDEALMALTEHMVDCLARNPCGKEVVPLPQALGRVIGEEIIAGMDLPGFARSTVDGFAVRARETFAASETAPVMLQMGGSIAMGEVVTAVLGPQQAFAIATGGMLPRGADAVVMLEDTEMLDTTVAVYRGVAPGENVVQPDEDVARGTVVLRPGQWVRPQELGFLAALGITRVPVVQRPRVGIISTGDEIVPPEAPCRPGQVRDINSYSLWGLTQQAGGEPVLYGVVPDEFDQLLQIARKAVDECHLVVISGGSSVGVRDHTYGVIEALEEGEVFINGVTVRPGKPTIAGSSRGRLIFGLPGHPVSAMVIFHLFVRPVILRFLGTEARRKRVTARLALNISSRLGREEYVRVRFVNAASIRESPAAGLVVTGASVAANPALRTLSAGARPDLVHSATCYRKAAAAVPDAKRPLKACGQMLRAGEGNRRQLWVEPVFAKSGMISSLVQADGLVRVPMDREGYEAGTEVEVELF